MAGAQGGSEFLRKADDTIFSVDDTTPFWAMKREGWMAHQRYSVYLNGVRELDANRNPTAHAVTSWLLHPWSLQEGVNSTVWSEVPQFSEALAQIANLEDLSMFANRTGDPPEGVRVFTLHTTAVFVGSSSVAHIYIRFVCSNTTTMQTSGDHGEFWFEDLRPGLAASDPGYGILSPGIALATTTVVVGWPLLDQHNHIELEFSIGSPIYVDPAHVPSDPEIYTVPEGLLRIPVAGAPLVGLWDLVGTPMLLISDASPTGPSPLVGMGAVLVHLGPTGQTYRTVKIVMPAGAPFNPHSIMPAAAHNAGIPRWIHGFQSDLMVSGVAHTGILHLTNVTFDPSCVQHDGPEIEVVNCDHCDHDESSSSSSSSHHHGHHGHHGGGSEEESNDEIVININIENNLDSNQHQTTDQQQTNDQTVEQSQEQKQGHGRGGSCDRSCRDYCDCEAVGRRSYRHRIWSQYYGYCYPETGGCTRCCNGGGGHDDDLCEHAHDEDNDDDDDDDDDDSSPHGHHIVSGVNAPELPDGTISMGGGGHRHRGSRTSGHHHGGGGGRSISHLVCAGRHYQPWHGMAGVFFIVVLIITVMCCTLGVCIWTDTTPRHKQPPHRMWYRAPKVVNVTASTTTRTRTHTRGGTSHDQ
jgi:hypothetical protein